MGTKIHLKRPPSHLNFEADVGNEIHLRRSERKESETKGSIKFYQDEPLKDASVLDDLAAVDPEEKT